MFVGGKDNLIL